MKYISKQHSVEAWALEPENILPILKRYLKDQAEGCAAFSLSMGHQEPSVLTLSERASQVVIPQDGYAVRRVIDGCPKWSGMTREGFEAKYEREKLP